jgi:hypothetical protein
MRASIRSMKPGEVRPRRRLSALLLAFSFLFVACGKTAAQGKREERENELAPLIEASLSVEQEQQDEARRLYERAGAEEKANRVVVAAGDLARDIFKAEADSGIDAAQAVFDARSAALVAAITEACTQRALTPADLESFDSSLAAEAERVCSLGKPVKHHGKPDPPPMPPSKAAKYQALCDAFRRSVARRSPPP